MTRFNAFLLFAAAVFMTASAAAEELVFSLRGFSREYHVEDWVMPDDPLLVRAVMLVGKRVEDCMPVDFLPLFAARNPAVAREMLAAGMPVDMRGPNRETALFHVRDTETARVLLDAGADVNAVDENDHTALWRAAHGDIVELLLARGARLSADDDGYDNILETAADAKAVRLLVAAGADAKAQTEFSSPLVSAQNAGVVRALLEAGADARYKDNHGKTPLHVAPDAESARLLIAAGAEVDGRYQPSRGAFAIMEDDSPPPVPLTPLAEVVEKFQYPFSIEQPEEKIRIARVLVAAGADVNVKGKYGGNLLDKVRNPELMKLLLEAGADVNARNRDGQTPLMKADNAECAKLLIAAGADIHARDDEGCTPLLHAGSAELMKLLLDAGADVNAKDKKGRTSISYVGQGEHVRLLLAAGANAVDLWRWGNPLFHVLDVEAATLVIELLRADGQDVKKLVNEQDEKGNTPLMHAVAEHEPGFFTYQIFEDAIPELDLLAGKYRWLPEQEGSQDMLGLVRAFVAAGADGNLANEEGEIPLFYARKPETVRLLLKADVPSQEKLDTALFRVIGNNAPSESVGVLLEAGANANARDKLGWSPLLLLAEASSRLHSDIPAITRLLVEAGADVDIQPYWEGDEEYDWMAYTGGYSGKQEPKCFSALHMMCDWEAVQVLLDAGANIETWTPEQSTPLHTRGDCPLVVRTLIAAGADVNARNEGWRTPLFYACDSRSVRLLVAAGADVNARDEDGRTPIFEHVSVQWTGYDVVQTLIALGADVNARDEEGDSVLSQVHEDDWGTREKLIAAGAEE